MATARATTEMLEKRAGLLLLAAAALALLLANSPIADAYHHLLDARLGPAMPRLGVMSVHSGSPTARWRCSSCSSGSR